MPPANPTKEEIDVYHAAGKFIDDWRAGGYGAALLTLRGAIHELEKAEEREQRDLLRVKDILGTDQVITRDQLLKLRELFKV